MTVSIITPSFGQFNWLRLCIASVADQLTLDTQTGQSQVEIQKSIKKRNYDTERFGEKAPHVSGIEVLECRGFALEHIIQDGGTPGIEMFAREMGDFLKSRYGGDFVSELQPFELLNLRAESGYTLRIFSEPDTGMYDAINRGIARSSGQVCAWLNSDEQYLDGALREVACFFTSNPPVDVLLGDAILMSSKFRPLALRRILVPWRWHTRLAHLHSLSCSMFFRKEALPSPPLDPRWRVIGDAVLMDWFLRSGKKVISSRRSYACYSFTGQNLSAVRSCTEHEDWMKELGFPPPSLTHIVKVFHRIRCLFAGAYRRATVDVRVYTFGTPECRTPVHASVGGRWPKTESIE
jgi:glycosyltransferase involved in cell wall biosynthesis